MVYARLPDRLNKINGFWYFFFFGIVAPLFKIFFFQKLEILVFLRVKQLWNSVTSPNRTFLWILEHCVHTLAKILYWYDSSLEIGEWEKFCVDKNFANFENSIILNNLKEFFFYIFRSKYPDAAVWKSLLKDILWLWPRTITTFSSWILFLCLNAQPKCKKTRIFSHNSK